MFSRARSAPRSAASPPNHILAAGGTVSIASLFLAGIVPGLLLATAFSISQRGVPGPGYLLQPWQSLLYGHGDPYLRARERLAMAQWDQVIVPTFYRSLREPGSFDAEAKTRVPAELDELSENKSQVRSLLNFGRFDLSPLP